MHSYHSHGAVLVLWFTDIEVHRRRRLLLNRVQWPVQSEWQGNPVPAFV